MQRYTMVRSSTTRYTPHDSTRQSSTLHYSTTVHYNSYFRLSVFPCPSQKLLVRFRLSVFPCLSRKLLQRIPPRVSEMKTERRKRIRVSEIKTERRKRGSTVHCIVLYCVKLYCNTRRYSTLHSTLHHTAWHYITLHYYVLCPKTLRRTSAKSEIPEIGWSMAFKLACTRNAQIQ